MVKHRGPDDEGIVFFSPEGHGYNPFGGHDTADNSFNIDVKYAPKHKYQNIAPKNSYLALAHRRLSIIDISSFGHQPMCGEDGRHWITYNGEIYNYIELRKELKDYGYRFTSDSDTEVIVNAYDRWGTDCLTRFNGMFSFVLFDNKLKRMFVARDRFGIKPLYYWKSPYGFLAIASEIKQFTSLPGWKAILNPMRAYDFITWGLTDHTDETLFLGVKQLRGGHFAEFDLKAIDDELSVTRWYRLKPENPNCDNKGAVDILKHLFDDSVRIRLRSDVPVGSCLSGGLDSSSIVCIANKIMRENHVNDLQKTFSARAHYHQFDEGEYIESVVEKTGVDDHHIYPELDVFFGSVDRLIWHQDEPFSTTSIYAQWHVFKLAASNNIKVMLDGQGADEQLAGYKIYFPTLYAGLLKSFQWKTLWKELQSAKSIHGFSMLNMLKQIIDMLLPNSLRQPLRKMVGKSTQNPSWLNVKRLGAKTTDPFYTLGSVGGSVENLSCSQLMHTHLPMLLHWEDRSSMSYSVESRVPFLDYRLVEFLTGLPNEHKISKGKTKKILREAMDGVLPEKVRNRMDKVGFVTPEEIWVTESAPAEFVNLLKQSIKTSQGILNPNALDKLDNIITGKEPYDHGIWRMICFGRWMDRFNVSISSS